MQHYINDNIDQILLPLDGLEILKEKLKKHFRNTNVNIVKMKTYLEFNDHTNPKMKKLTYKIYDHEIPSMFSSSQCREN